MQHSIFIGFFAFLFLINSAMAAPASVCTKVKGYDAQLEQFVARAIGEDVGNSCCVAVERIDEFGQLLKDCFCICPGDIDNSRWGSLVCQAPFTVFYPSSDVSGGLVANCDKHVVSPIPVPVSPVKPIAALEN